MARAPAPSLNKHIPVYPMRTIVRLAGVKRHVIYAWEKRGLIKPARTEGGHRLCSEQDVERIRWIKGLVDQGVSLNRIPRLNATGDGSG